MGTLSGRDADLLRAERRAAAAYKRVSNGTSATFSAALCPAPTAQGRPRSDEKLPIGTVMSGLMKHGGVYTLVDAEMMEHRFKGIAATMAAEGAPDAAMAEARVMMTTAKSVPTFFFYHLVARPYPLPSQLVSYLAYPARHLATPVGTGAPPPPTPSPSPPSPSLGPIDIYQPVYDQVNAPSRSVPAAVTFIGQFIDHDLTLNAVNLLEPQKGEVRSQASPLIDLDSVYGPRIDDAGARAREIPMRAGSFCLDPIAGSSAYDVCRAWDAPSQTWRALIGDKRNDENQLILQVHILAMRLHNHFMKGKPAGYAAKAKQETILHWQAMVATYYLPLVARGEAIVEVIRRLFDEPDKLCHRPGLTLCGGCTLGMPHEFAIGFRFGHSQLRSEYQLVPDPKAPNPKIPPIRLFDSRGVTIPNSPFKRVPEHDLQGGKKLAHDHVIDWHFFAGPAMANEIDTKVNEDVFDLPGSAIPDDVKLVTNLPLRNLIRSDSVGLCAGEDLASHYQGVYGGVLPIAPLTGAQVDALPQYQPLFKLDQDAAGNPTDEFRTPLWYYLLREAEVERLSNPAKATGQLGMLGSLLVAEVLLSGMRYAGEATSLPGNEESIFKVEPWKTKLTKWKPTDGPLISFLDLVKLVEASNVAPPKCKDAD